MAKWKAVEFNLAKNLQARNKTAAVTIPDSMLVTITVELDDKLFAELEKDPSRAAHIQQNAKAKADSAVDAMVKQIEAITSKPLDQKAAVEASKKLNESFQQALDKAGADINKETEQLLSDFKKGRKELTNFRVKSGAKIAINGTAMVVATAVAGASHGALSPIAAVGIVRGSVAIGQECLKLASTADTTAKLVQVQIAALKVIMQKDLANASTRSKVAQGVKEIGLGVLSGITGFQGIPSMKNCNENIKLHKINISKLDQKSHDLSVKLNEALKSWEEWKAKNDAAIKTMPSDKVGKIRSKMDTIEKATGKLLEATTKVNVGVTRANQRQGTFETTMDAMTQGLPSWIGYADTVAALALDIGLAIGDAGSLIEGASSVLLAVSAEIGAFQVDAAGAHA